MLIELVDNEVKESENLLTDAVSKTCAIDRCWQTLGTYVTSSSWGGGGGGGREGECILLQPESQAMCTVFRACRPTISTTGKGMHSAHGSWKNCHPTNTHTHTHTYIINACVHIVYKEAAYFSYF